MQPGLSLSSHNEQIRNEFNAFSNPRTSLAHNTNEANMDLKVH